MRYDIITEVSDLTQSSSGYNWVLHLPLYQMQYNSSFHKALGTFCTIYIYIYIIYIIIARLKCMVLR